MKHAPNVCIGVARNFQWRGPYRNRGAVGAEDGAEVETRGMDVQVSPSPAD